MSTGLEPGVEFVEPYVASITFFGINMMAGIVLRALTAAIVPEPLKGLTLSFLATMEACAYFFENNFVFKVRYSHQSSDCQSLLKKVLATYLDSY